MTIASELTALQGDITSARAAVTAKGGSVTSGGGSSQLATDIATIPTGITPSGNINITNTSQVDVTNYATAQVVDGDLTAENVKNGINILGVLGTCKQVKIAEGTFTGHGTFSQTITHNLGTQNVIVFIQAYKEDGTALVGTGRYQKLFVAAFSRSFVPFPDQKYKYTDSGTEQSMNQCGLISFYGSATATQTIIGNDQSYDNGVVTTDNAVTVQGSLQFFSGVKFKWRVYGFMDGVS